MKGGAARAGIAEQFTYFGTLRNDGQFQANALGQRLKSSITQLFGSYDLSDKWQLQANVPLIARSFKRLNGHEVEYGSETGLGDVSLLARTTLYAYRAEEDMLYIHVFGGLKLPTGDSDRLREEAGSQPTTAKHTGPHAEGDPLNAIHGHDLALGSGSFDFPVGVSLFALTDRLFGSAELQYVIRTEGDADYRYADDFLWSVGPGYFLYLQDEWSIALRAKWSGEYKRSDRVAGAREPDTALRTVFFGPELEIQNGRWIGEIAWESPLDADNGGFQLVADERFRAAVTYRFN